jgi:hypothetical protein
VFPWLRFNGKWARLYNTNDTPDISFFWHNQELSFGLLIAPNNGRRFTVSGDWMYQNYNSSILTNIPFPVATVDSLWIQHGHSASLFANVNLFHNATLNFGGTMMVNHGTQPTAYYQPRVEFMIPLHSHITWFNNWQYWDFNEKFLTENPSKFYPTLQNFNANLFSTGLRINLGRRD